MEVGVAVGSLFLLNLIEVMCKFISKLFNKPSMKRVLKGPDMLILIVIWILMVAMSFLAV